MSEWHRDNPELAGTDADPWMMHETYRSAMAEVKRMSGYYCSVCTRLLVDCDCEAPDG